MRVEAIDDTDNPLGPLGDTGPEPEPIAATIEAPPQPPIKEVNRGVVAGRDDSGLGESIEVGDGIGGDIAAGGMSGRSSGEQQQQQLVQQQPQKPIFEVTVGDPHKVGDLTSSHTVYQVRTKVNSS